MVHMRWFLKGLFLIGLIEAKHHKLGQLFFFRNKKIMRLTPALAGRLFMSDRPLNRFSDQLSNFIDLRFFT